MADPFEVRMRFTAQLQHLNASANSSQKAAHYALKYRDMDEDLHSCILEQLERVSTPKDDSQMFKALLTKLRTP
jgi:CTD kinase subunit gamma